MLHTEMRKEGATLKGWEEPGDEAISEVDVTKKMPVIAKDTQF